MNMNSLILFYILYLRSSENKNSTNEVSKRCEENVEEFHSTESDKLSTDEIERKIKYDALDETNIFKEVFDKENDKVDDKLDKVDDKLDKLVKVDDKNIKLGDKSDNNDNKVDDKDYFIDKNLEDLVYKIITEYDKKKEDDLKDLKNIILDRNNELSNYKLNLEKELTNLKEEIQKLETNLKTEIESKIIKYIDDKIKLKDWEKEIQKKVTDNMFANISKDHKCSEKSDESKETKFGENEFANLVNLVGSMIQPFCDGSLPRSETPNFEDLLNSSVSKMNDECKKERKN